MLESLAESQDWIYHLVLLSSSMGGALLIALGIPGQFLPVLVSGVFWLMAGDSATEEMSPSATEVAVLFSLGIMAELLEFVSGWLGGRTAGSRWQGTLGGMLGGVLGAIFGHILMPFVGGIFGIIAGPFVGAVFGEKMAPHEGGNEHAIQVGLASAIGRTLGLVGKLAVVLGIGFWAILRLIF